MALRAYYLKIQLFYLSEMTRKDNKLHHKKYFQLFPLKLDDIPDAGNAAQEISPQSSHCRRKACSRNRHDRSEAGIIANMAAAKRAYGCRA